MNLKENRTYFYSPLNVLCLKESNTEAKSNYLETHFYPSPKTKWKPHFP